jgi:phosphatidylglycerophosphatase A
MSNHWKPLFNADPEIRRIAFSTPWGFLALGLGSGLFRAAPGTAGTVVAIPLALALVAIPPWLAISVVVGLFIAGIPLCRVTAQAMGEADPGAIVWDEIVAFGLLAVLAPPGWPWLIAAFLAFRFFDIAKPWPISWLESRVKGGLGVMIDDVVAALYAAAVLRLAELVLP